MFTLLQLLWKDIRSLPENFLKLIRSTFTDTSIFMRLAFNPRHIKVKYLIIFICVLGVSIVVYFTIDRQTRADMHRARLAANDNLSLGNKQPVFYDSPFFYPFQRPGHLIVATPFSRDHLYGGEYNSSGFQTPEYTITHPPNTFRILILGDSIAWARNTLIKEAFPYQLQENLNKHCGTSGIEVISLALPTFRLRDTLLTLLAHGESLNPDLILIQLRSMQFHIDIDKDGEVVEVKSTQSKSVAGLSDTLESLNDIRKWSDRSGVRVAFLTQDDFLNQVPANEFVSLNLSGVAGNSGNWDPGASIRVADRVRRFLFEQHLISCAIPQTPNIPLALWEKEKQLRASAAQQWVQIKDDDSKRLSFYQTLHQLLPDNVWIINHLAQAQLALRQTKDAFSTYQSLRDLAPGLAAPWFQMSLCVSDQAQKKQFLERTVEVLPDHLMATRILADNYISERRFRDGCKLLKHLTEIPQFQGQLEAARRAFAENDCKDNLSE